MWYTLLHNKYCQEHPLKILSRNKKWDVLEFGNLCSKLHFEFTASKDSLWKQRRTVFCGSVFCACAPWSLYINNQSTPSFQFSNCSRVTSERVSTNQNALHIPNDNYSIYGDFRRKTSIRIFGKPVKDVMFIMILVTDSESRCRALSGDMRNMCQFALWPVELGSRKK
jgi:hypothetical protein